MSFPALCRPALLLMAALLLSGCASLGNFFSPEPSPAPSATATRKVVAYALEVEAPAELRALLLEHLDLARFQHTDESERLSALELDRLAATTPAQARALLETEGFFNAGVSMERPSPDRVIVRVQPGPRSTIKSLDLSFSGELQADEALQQGLRRDWALPVGGLFSQSAWSSAKTAVLGRARANGYPLARWGHTTAAVNAETNEAELQLQLDSGPLFRLGALQIEGLKYYAPSTIERLAGFAPGEPYSERLLQDFQERLQKTLLFDSVNVEIQPEAGEYRATPVLVRVREAPRQQATTGIGYHANTGQRLTLEHVHRQPFGLALRSKTKLDLGRDLRAIELELSSHPQPDMARNLGALQVEEDRSGDQVLTNLSARLGRLRERGSDERLIYAELLRAREVQAGNKVSSGAASLNTQWIRRRLDSTLLPTDGHQALLLLGAGRADSSDARNGLFGKVHLKFGAYRPLGSNWYGNARLEWGQVFTSAEVGIPEKLLFRAGGDESVRGYAYRSLGPLREGLAVGGRVLGTASLELARPLSPKLPAFWGAVFVDAGQAADSWRDFKPAFGYGLGLRWRSPVGPLRIDIARGEALKAWRLHFSVGIAL